MSHGVQAPSYRGIVRPSAAGFERLFGVICVRVRVAWMLLGGRPLGGNIIHTCSLFILLWKLAHSPSRLVPRFRIGHLSSAVLCLRAFPCFEFNSRQ